MTPRVTPLTATHKNLDALVRPCKALCGRRRPTSLMRRPNRLPKYVAFSVEWSARCTVTISIPNFMITKVKILQHNGLDANVFSETSKASKNLHRYFAGPLKILEAEVFRDGRQPEAQELFTSYVDYSPQQMMTTLGYDYNDAASYFF